MAAGQHFNNNVSCLQLLLLCFDIKPCCHFIAQDEATQICMQRASEGLGHRRRRSRVNCSLSSVTYQGDELARLPRFAAFPTGHGCS